VKRMSRREKKSARAKRPILIFPEGTPQRTSAQRLLSDGIVALYRQLDIPIVAGRGQSGLFGEAAFLKAQGGSPSRRY